MGLGSKKAAKAVWGAIKKTGNAVDPAKMAGRAVDEAVDSLKDDEFIVEGESRLVVFGVEIGRLSHLMRVHVADKES